jgi:hypothetical protein
MERKSSSPIKINSSLSWKILEILDRIVIADFVVIDIWSYLAFHLNFVSGFKLYK